MPPFAGIHRAAVFNFLIFLSWMPSGNSFGKVSAFGQKRTFIAMQKEQDK